MRSSSIYARMSKDSHFRQGYFYQMEGDLHAAAECYLRSIQNCPSAEAHTFLGWILSQIGSIDDAIAECRKAIKLDPDFGNAWNDIGAYMIEKRNYDKAIRYLRKACKAKNYDNVEYPHYNLAWVFVQKGMLLSAVKQLKRAVKLNPGFGEAKRLLERVEPQIH